jgi:hypothetical protein
MDPHTDAHKDAYLFSARQELYGFSFAEPFAVAAPKEKPSHRSYEARRRWADAVGGTRLTHGPEGRAASP